MVKKLLTIFVSLLFAPAARGVIPAPIVDDAIFRKGVELLASGHQSDAERFIFDEAPKHPSAHVYFLVGVLVRSRFDTAGAAEDFKYVVAKEPQTTEGIAAKLIMAMDAGTDTEANFKSLDELVTANPQDALLLWMSAVECRQLDKPREGIERYTRLLKMWNPGPSLLHQTMGNLFMDDGKPAQALEHYDQAIKLEPAAWDYNCRGNALTDLKRFDEATQAYQKATELDPDYDLTWKNWSRLCEIQHDTAGALEKLKKFVEVREKQR